MPVVRTVFAGLFADAAVVDWPREVETGTVYMLRIIRQPDMDVSARDQLEIVSVESRQPSSGNISILVSCETHKRHVGLHDCCMHANNYGHCVCSEDLVGGWLNDAVIPNVIANAHTPSRVTIHSIGVSPHPSRTASTNLTTVSPKSTSSKGSGIALTSTG
jgi:hypothetical protein